MKTLTIETTLPKFARNKSAFDDALFTGSVTFDGYIDKVLRDGQIKIRYMDETYVLNHDHVFCYETKMPDGRNWYSYGGKLNSRLSHSQTYELEDVIRKMVNATEAK